MAELRPCKRCGGEAEVFSHYIGVYERIHGFAECKSCKQRVWVKVSFDTYEVNTQHPNFPEWKRNVYERVEKSIVEEWNKVMG